MTFTVRPEILAAYKLANHDYSSDEFVAPVTSPSPITTHKKKRPPGDRSLRSDSWFGGYVPPGEPKPRPSYTIKREIFKN